MVYKLRVRKAHDRIYRNDGNTALIALLDGDERKVLDDPSCSKPSTIRRLVAGDIRRRSAR